MKFVFGVPQGYNFGPFLLIIKYMKEKKIPLNLQFKIIKDLTNY